MGNLQSLDNSVGLSKAEIDRLERRLKKLGRGRAEVARSDLRGVSGLAQNPFMERIFQMYDAGTYCCFGHTWLNFVSLNQSGPDEIINQFLLFLTLCAYVRTCAHRYGWVDDPAGHETTHGVANES